MNCDNERIYLEELESLYFQEAILKFEARQYKEAVENFIKVYEMGLDQAEEVLNILYSCFISPNEDEFRENYSTNTKGVTLFPYENTEIDFVPVAEDCYYMYDKAEKRFVGFFQLGQEDEKVEKNFHSLLISDVWDIRNLSDIFRETEYRRRYYLINEQKGKFYSFLKLPKFAELYLNNAECFEDSNAMKKFFVDNPDYYLPKKFVGDRIEECCALISGIHEKRKSDVGVTKKNVFLSICIPAYNRGHMLEKSVKHMLQMEYDSEIEIIISDDGSTENLEGYFEIASIQDSRLKCMRKRKNEGYASNVINVIEQASGQFVMLSADKDSLILENIETLLNKLWQNLDKGMMSVNGYGVNFRPCESIEETVLKRGVESMWKGLHMNLLARCVFNTDVLKRYNILEKVKQYRGNVFLEFYVHMVIAMYVGNYAEHYQSSLPIWIEGNAGDVGGFHEKEKQILRYMTPESRIAQHEGVMKLIENLYRQDSEIYEWFFLNYLRRTYRLLLLLRRRHKEEFEQKYEWKNVCECIYAYSMDAIQSEKLTEMAKKRARQLYDEHLEEIA